MVPITFHNHIFILTLILTIVYKGNKIYSKIISVMSLLTLFTVYKFQLSPVF